MTALTTLPFFTVPSGEASFTAAVTISPSPAFTPSPPPSGRITCSLRAPELSATASMVLICTPMDSPPLPLRLLGGFYFSGFSSRVFNLRQRRTPYDFFQRPPLQLAGRPGLANADHVAQAGGVLL